MTNSGIDPLARKAQADLIIDRTAGQLSKLVHDLAAELEPFPPFPGAFFTNAIEVEADAAASRERGCVVVGADGELYEFQMGVDLENMDAFADPVAMRKEELIKIELHPRDYVVYAYNAVTALVEVLLERSEA
jgi:hypothetical protein